MERATLSLTAVGTLPRCVGILGQATAALKPMAPWFSSLLLKDPKARRKDVIIPPTQSPAAVGGGVGLEPHLGPLLCTLLQPPYLVFQLGQKSAP